jgi:predicted RNA binding protein YcfA (HicA-like mRNA interferase family)
MKARDLVKAVEGAGWRLVRVQGSHHIYKHPTNAGRVIIPIHGLARDVPTGLMLSILKQAGLR